MLNPIQLGSKRVENQFIPNQSKYLKPSLGKSGIDIIELSKPNSSITFSQKGKALNVVSFTGLKNPLDAQKPALQMKVRGVTAHQESKDPKVRTFDDNINRLADSNWQDGQDVEFSIIKGRRGRQITLSVPGLGEIGRVPDEVARNILPVIQKSPQNFKFELSNIVAGMSKGAETIGLRVNLLYEGNDKKEEASVKQAFNKVLNDPESMNSIMLYQPKTSPEEILKLILDYEKNINGSESEAKMQEAIGNIVKEIKNPINKNILLVGHCKPDGDTLGSVLGLKNAIKLMDPERKVDGAIDDKIPGLFRHKLPGIDGEIKRPYNPERIQNIEQEIVKLKEDPQNDQTKSQIELLEQELKDMQRPEDFLDPKSKYDLVILLDVPTPERFTNQFKKYIEDAKKVIYIDHHPHRPMEWNDKATMTGLNMKKVHDNKLAWIADTVPAATQLVSIVASKLLPSIKEISDGTAKASEIFNKPGQFDRFKAFVASIVTGASTDTGSFTRTANMLPEHIAMPVQDRPNFMPEGESKFLMDMTQGGITKKWLREEINYDISDEKLRDLGDSARDLMLKRSLEGKNIYSDLSLGIVEVDYDKMYEILHYAREAEKQEGKKPETTLLDVQNSFKYSEVIGTLRGNPRYNKKDSDSKTKEPESTGDKAKEDYVGSYDDDRIAILICQDKKAGRLDEKLNIADQNGLRLSFRSQEGTIWAELLANLFHGGGHGGASGGRVDLPGVTLDSKLAVKINDKIENDPAVILEQLKKNHEIMNNSRLTDDQKQAKTSKFEMIIDEQKGKVCSDLIADIVKVIRATQPASRTNNASNGKNNVVPFRDMKNNKVVTSFKDIGKLFNKETVNK
ncbi:MAG: hypothetical protein ACD_20C00041G0001 [uncultured bacterium]|nr:MAG: hypothetical protein ACD_20C00041G0001 [uncultured bacterium]HBH17686.1 hypothetical protein [Cyanobacteria bacterium UBA9579]